MAHQTLDVWDVSRGGGSRRVHPQRGRIRREARDGSIGKVDEATFDTDSSSLVIDTGPWIFGKKVMLPAGVIRSVDHADEKIFVNRTKDEIKNAPEFDDSLLRDRPYRDQLGSYYGPGGAGFRDWDDV